MRMIGDEIAADPMTTRDIAETVLAAANISKPDKAAQADLIGTINSSLRNHAGKGVQQVNDGIPARWELGVSSSD